MMTIISCSRPMSGVGGVGRAGAGQTMAPRPSAVAPG